MSRYLGGKREIPVDILFRIKKELNISDREFMNFYNEYSVKDRTSKFAEKISKLNPGWNVFLKMTFILRYILMILYSYN